MAQKTLIIGLGTTGKKIAMDVLRRIEDEFDDVKRVPWIEVAVFETARITDETEMRLLNGRVGDIGIPQDQWQAILRAGPEGYSNIDLHEWYDPIVLNLNNIGTTYGAGNVRMIGRLCWLYPKCQQDFHNLINGRMQVLTGLTPEQANARVGELPYREGPPNITFGDDPQRAQSVNVFVCGTLTGGTCSGSFIDVGYFLRGMPATANSTRVGLFTIPNIAVRNVERVSNAYAALTELNHFHQDGCRYRAKFPTLNGGTTTEFRSVTPYDSVFLCRPETGVDGAEESIIRSFGQYIYMQSMSSVGAEAGAALINPAMTNAKDTFGNPMNFASLGVSVLEYPAAHIVKGCRYRLLSRAIGQWLHHPELEKHLAEQIAGEEKGCGLDEVYLRADLIAVDPQALPIDTRLTSAIENARSAASTGSMPEASDIEANIEAAFVHGRQAPEGAFQSGELSQLIVSNASKVKAIRVKRAKQLVAESLKDLDRGPNWCLGFISGLNSLCERKLKEIGEIKTNDSENIAAAYSNLEDARARVEACHGMRLPFFRNAALTGCLKQYEDASVAYFNGKLSALVTDQIEGIYKLLLDFAKMVEPRLQHPLCGVKEYGSNLLNLLAEKDASADAHPPRVNGHLLFQQGETIQSDYERCLANVVNGGMQGIVGVSSGEEFAKRKVLADWEWLSVEVTKDQGRSYFDPKASQAISLHVLPEHYQQAWNSSGHYFGTLFHTDVLERLYERHDARAIIDDVYGKSSQFLSINDVPRNLTVQGDHAGAQHLFRGVFFRGAGEPNNITPAGRFNQAIAGIPPRPFQLAEPYRVVFCSARTTFSISTVEGFSPEHQHEFRGVFDTRLPKIINFTRTYKNVSWTDLENAVPFQGIGMIKAQILALIAARKIVVTPGIDMMYTFNRDGGANAGRISLSIDLQEAALKIHDHQRAYFALTEDIREESLFLQEFAAKLSEFANQVGPYNIEHKKQRIQTEADVFEILNQLVYGTPGLRDTMAQRYGRLPVEQDYYRPATATSAAGYYCPVSGELLKTAWDHRPLPDRCPNCSAILLFNQ